MCFSHALSQKSPLLYHLHKPNFYYFIICIMFWRILHIFGLFILAINFQKCFFFITLLCRCPRNCSLGTVFLFYVFRMFFSYLCKHPLNVPPGILWNLTHWYIYFFFLNEHLSLTVYPSWVSPCLCNVLHLCEIKVVDICMSFQVQSLTL